jgi:hypothetical protein
VPLVASPGNIGSAIDFNNFRSGIGLAFCFPFPLFGRENLGIAYAKRLTVVAITSYNKNIRSKGSEQQVIRTVEGEKAASYISPSVTCVGKTAAEKDGY